MTKAERQYLETALWSSSDPESGEPLDNDYGPEDIEPKRRAELLAELADFLEANQADLEVAGIDDERAAHLFWLNRNGHGAGFWDAIPSGSAETDKALRRLSEASKVYGGVDLLPIDGGMVA